MLPYILLIALSYVAAIAVGVLIGVIWAEWD